jgi:gliding motility-associated-like protein
MKNQVAKMRKVISLSLFLCLLCLAQFLGFAQACFTTDVQKGCAPLKVTAKNCSPTTDSRLIFYDFGDGVTPKTEDTYTYTKAGKYFIKQFINSNPGQQSDGNYLIEVLEAETPKFSVEFCSSNAVIVKILTNGMPQYKINYGDGTTDEVSGLTSTTHKYSDNQQRTITVEGYIPTEKLVCGSATQTITPLATIAPAEFQQVKILANNDIELTFKQTAPNSYRVTEFSANNNVVQTINLADNKTTQLLLTGRNAATDLFLYRVNPYDQCSNSAVATVEGIATTQLTVTAQPKKNLLKWNILNTTGFTAYKIYRNSVLLQTLNAAQTKTFIDENVNCNELYSYYVEVLLNDGKSKSISTTKTIRAASANTPTPITKLFASTNQNTVFLEWEYPKDIVVQKVLITKQLNGQETIINQTPQNTFFYDAGLNTAKDRACYTLAYIDECGNLSEKSVAVCNILLQGSNDGNTINLNWLSNLGADASIFLEKFDENNVVISTTSVSSNGAISESKDSQNLAYFGYRIRIVWQGNTLYSNDFRVVIPTQIAVPTAFSPNGDGLNDTFKPLIKYVLQYRLQIFNQWGNIVFETNDINTAWDGSNGGFYMASGVYVSQITYRDGNGVQHLLTNPLTLLR